jgi:hypothetical protein
MNPKVTKINVKTADELLKMLYTSAESSARSQLNVRGFWPNPGFRANELKNDPNATTMTVYEHDGSDYTIKISDVEAIVEFYN